MLEHERISAKLTKFRPSLTLALKRLAEERKARKLPVYDFGLGETKGTLAQVIREAGEAAFREEDTMYADPAGLPELRDAVLTWMDHDDHIERHYTRDNVVISAGAKQSLFNIFLAICNPSDCVLLDSAPWVSYQPLITAAYGFPVQVLPLAAKEASLKVTADDLRRNLSMRPHAKMFLLNSPCNPTGQAYTTEEINSLLDVCVEHKIYFVLDRLYWRIMFDGRKYASPKLNKDTLPWLVQVDGMSKNFRRTGGLRIGWAIGPDDLVKAMVNVQSHYTSGPATPTQRAALAAITHTYDKSMVQELELLRDLLWQEVEGIQHVRVWPTEGAFYSFWDVRACFGKKTPDGKVLANSDDVSEYLVVSSGVLTASGKGFMQDGYLRLSFATPAEQVREGMRAAKKAMAALK
jgi:aspartate aminotransferase